jgi:hypothetical protein
MDYFLPSAFYQNNRAPRQTSFPGSCYNATGKNAKEAAMTYQGHIEKGSVVVDAPVPLPDGIRVMISPVEDSGSAREDENVPTLYEQFKSFIGIADGLPNDLAMNHDHYLHGQPKR